MISSDDLLAIMPNAITRIGAFLDPLNSAMKEFEIDVNGARETAFLAQIAHESNELKSMLELADGSEYEGATHLGNTQPGDGPRFKGRGPMQLTGRKNYGLCGEALGLDLIGHPELLELPGPGCRSAGWFWAIGAGLNLGKAAHAYGIKDGVNLNDLADAGDFRGITLAVNGGLNGYQQRLAYFEKATEVLA